MADVQEIIRRFEDVGWFSDTTNNEDGGKFCESITTFDWDVIIRYYYGDDEWCYGSNPRKVSESSVLALLEALERLENEAKNNGDSTHN